MKILKKIIKNNTVYDTGFDILKQNIDTVVDELNKIEIPTKLSELENDMGFVQEQPNNEIWYTTTDGEIIEPTQVEGFLDKDENQLTILSNTYKDGKGVIKFNGDLAYTRENASSDGVFDSQNRLMTISLPKSVESIGIYAFFHCSNLTSVTIPNSVTSINSNAFHKCTSLTSITIPDSVTTIGNYAFWECTSLTSINIPNSVTSIGIYAFRECSSLTSVTIPNSVTSIGQGAFAGCTSLTSITISNSVTSIDYEVFEFCTSLQSITIPDSVTTIDVYAFAGCTSLTSITIPDSVTSISEDAFAEVPSTEGTLYCSKEWYNNLTPDMITNLGNVYNWTKVYPIEDRVTELENKPFKTINGESIEGEGNIVIQGGGTSGDYLPLSGGTLTGHVQLGDGNTTGFKKVEAVRNINSVPNGAAFYVNSDGTAAFYHKTYGSTGLTNPINDAILRFNNEGLYFAKGETSRTTATDFKKVLTEDDAYNKTETDDKYALKSDVEELKLFKFPNATIFGTPTIQNGQVSNFSNDNYLQFPFLVDFQNRPFNIYFSFTTPSVMSGQENILDSNYGLAFAIREGRVVAVASDNGTSWTTGELISNETLTPNTTYYFKIYWDNNIFGYSGGMSKDDYSISKETIMLNTPYPKTMLIGRSFVNGGNHYNGSINLNDASLDISNKVVWQGMDDVGLATRAAVDLSNIDAKGVEVIENIVENNYYTKSEIDSMIGNINNILNTI